MKTELHKSNKKLMVIAGLVIIIMIGVAGTTPPAHPNLFKNLQVLPKDISKEALHKVMEQFTSGLGVHCNYCHVENNSTKHMDFASDSNHVKDAARYMMRMTISINKDYLEVKQPMIGDSTMVVTCYTCHHGNVYPDNKSKDSIPNKDFMPHRDSVTH